MHSKNPSPSLRARFKALRSPLGPLRKPAMLAVGLGMALVMTKGCTPAPTTTTTSTGFPNAANTGAVGTLAVHYGNMTVTAPNTVIENVEIRGTLSITATAKGTIVRNVRIVWPAGKANPGGAVWTMVDDRATGTVFQNCEVNGSGMVQTGLFLRAGSATISRCEIQGVADGIDVFTNTTVSDNYIHHMSKGPAGAWHVDSIQMTQGANVTIRHNTILNENIQTSAVGLWAETGGVAGVVIDNNLIGGGGYAIYATKVGLPMTGVKITNNRFTTRIFSGVGYWGGAMVYPSNKPADLVFSGNVIDETGKAVTK